MDFLERPHLVLSLRPVDTAVRAARDGVRAAMEGWDRPDPNGDLELITSELVTNAIRYAERITLVLYLPDDMTAMVEVWDDNPEGPAEIVASPQAEGGRGLQLVGALSSSWGWRPTGAGKVTWAQTATG
ncbi:ATP-binding protein [Actinomadura rubrisoli]|uniref:ATP-binding protein n=1 Tax=Actinomadura rubrisoli TaxID=2530368 RepID=A0A4V2YTV2_9ACTN|nr:ATP-binding protein [Actinomadura rubrisoli]TDD75097.1 ATP-binding protein [Actinomadura rubrisoli]